MMRFFAFDQSQDLDEFIFDSCNCDVIYSER